MEAPKPYIGISGVATAEQHGDLYGLAVEEKIADLGRFMMLGVQATSKTQLLNIENKYGQMWHPVGETISRACCYDETDITKPFVHCFFEGQDDLRRGLDVVMDRTDDYVRGVQINIAQWADEDYAPLLHDFKEKYLGQDVVLQAHRGILDNYTPQEMVKKLARLPVEYVLLDASHGQGVPLDSDYIKPFIDQIYHTGLSDHMNVVIAGGINADNMTLLVGPLLEEYPDLSIDAEGRLRKGDFGKTELDLKKVAEYVRAWKNVTKLIQEHRLHFM